MDVREVLIQIDDRIRLVSAVLSLTSWPEQEQRCRRFRPHVHARSTSQKLGALAGHPAVVTLQRLLDESVPLEVIYAYALHPETSAPVSGVGRDMADRWHEGLDDFFQAAGLASFWDEQSDLWQQAVQEAQRSIEETSLYRFLRRFVGPFHHSLIVMPNISYPADVVLGIRTDGALICLVPPRAAWGDNEPWPFDDDAGYLYTGMVTGFARLLLRSTADAWDRAACERLLHDGIWLGSECVLEPNSIQQLVDWLTCGLVALYLEETLGPQEAKAYLLFEQRARGSTPLSSAVDVLNHYLAVRAQDAQLTLASYLSQVAVCCGDTQSDAAR